MLARPFPNVVLAIGTASGHLVVLSTIVNRWVNPLSGANGPTRLTWTWLKWAAGTEIRTTSGFVCITTLLVSQERQFLAQPSMSRRIPGHCKTWRSWPRTPCQKGGPGCELHRRPASCNPREPVRGVVRGMCRTPRDARRPGS